MGTKKTIMVIGDIILDHYVFYNSIKLSAEAPVPVVEYDREEYRLGGAANVANNIVNLGHMAILVGFLGGSAEANTDSVISELITASGITYNWLYSNKQLSIKQRIIVDGQQFLRIDDEDTDSLYMNYGSILVKEYLPVDVIVLSDYAKGMLFDERLSEIISLAKNSSTPVIVDPKRYFNSYRNADVIVPNLKDLESWDIEYDDYLSKAEYVLQQANIGGMVLTKGAGGMSIYEDNLRHGVKHIGDIIPDPKDVAISVVDVCGASDTVVATLAVEIAKGTELYDAAVIANRAAQIVIRKFGTSVVTKEELFKEVI